MKTSAIIVFLAMVVVLTQSAPASIPAAASIASYQDKATGAAIPMVVSHHRGAAPMRRRRGLVDVVDKDKSSDIKPPVDTDARNVHVL